MLNHTSTFPAECAAHISKVHGLETAEAPPYAKHGSIFFRNSRHLTRSQLRRLLTIADKYDFTFEVHAGDDDDGIILMVSPT